MAAAEEWRWSSLWQRVHGEAGWLSPWPGRPPALDVWRAYVNGVQTEAEAAAVRRSVERGSPYGGSEWAARTVGRLGLESSLRPRGRPRKGRKS